MKREEREGILLRRIDRWVDALESLRLADYIRYVENRRRLLWSHFWAGVARGAG